MNHRTPVIGSVYIVVWHFEVLAPSTGMMEE